MCQTEEGGPNSRDLEGTRTRGSERKAMLLLEDGERILEYRGKRGRWKHERTSGPGQGRGRIGHQKSGLLRG